MMSALTRLHDEALRLLTIYEEHRDSNDEWLRRKVHVDLDRFLMENRDAAAQLMVQGLQEEINKLAKHKQAQDHRAAARWYHKIFRGGTSNVNQAR